NMLMPLRAQKCSRCRSKSLAKQKIHLGKLIQPAHRLPTETQHSLLEFSRIGKRSIRQQAKGQGTRLIPRLRELAQRQVDAIDRGASIYAKHMHRQVPLSPQLEEGLSRVYRKLATCRKFYAH